jgi:hypothetical protein
MSVATVIVRGLCDGKEVEVTFTATQQRPNDALRIIRSTVAAWSRIDKAIHTVTTSGKSLGQRITVQLAATDNRTMDRATRILKNNLELKGLSVNPAQSHDYSDFERNADIGLRV